MDWSLENRDKLNGIIIKLQQAEFLESGLYLNEAYKELGKLLKKK